MSLGSQRKRGAIVALSIGADDGLRLRQRSADRTPEGGFGKAALALNPYVGSVLDSADFLDLSAHRIHLEA